METVNIVQSLRFEVDLSRRLETFARSDQEEVLFDRRERFRKMRASWCNAKIEPINPLGPGPILTDLQARPRNAFKDFRE